MNLLVDDDGEEVALLRDIFSQASYRNCSVTTGAHRMLTFVELLHPDLKEP